MRIALFSDIHANLPALQAFLTDMDNRNLDAAYCLGDLVGYNVWPNEVVDEIRRRRIPTIAGNYDEGVGRKSDDCGCVYKTDDEKLMGKISISFTNHLVQPDQRHFLRTLPFSLSLEFRLADGPLTLVMVHGSPRHISEYLFEDRDERSLLRICKDARADILCFGHTHKPFHRILPKEEPAHGYHRHAINTGSSLGSMRWNGLWVWPKQRMSARASLQMRRRLFSSRSSKRYSEMWRGLPWTITSVRFPSASRNSTEREKGSVLRKCRWAGCTRWLVKEMEIFPMSFSSSVLYTQPQSSLLRPTPSS